MAIEQMGIANVGKTGGSLIVVVCRLAGVDKLRAKGAPALAAGL